MSGWVILFCLQSTLILMDKRRLHMVIGPVGGVLAAAIVILGSTVAALSVQFNPQIYGPFGGARFFLVIMFTQMVLFGTLVGIGIANRRRAEIHRPMMLLATLVILSGALGGSRTWPTWPSFRRCMPTARRCSSAPCCFSFTGE